MAKRATALDLATISLDANDNKALHQQVYDELRNAVLTGRLVTGARLPSTRLLSDALSVSRNTVVTAFEQLIAEGYLESRTGDGTYVSCALPDDMLAVRTPAIPAKSGSTTTAKVVHQNANSNGHVTRQPIILSRSSQAVESAKLGQWIADDDPRPFRPDTLALDHFPTHIWSRLVARCWRNVTTRLLSYAEPEGYRPLREAIAAYLGISRGVRCAPEQVLVTSGSQQGIDLAARTLLDPGDPVWMENPGYRGALGALIAVGAKLVPVPVDDEGLRVDVGEMACPKARMAYVTPSHQYPTGVTMTLTRRLALLHWAKRASAWIVEDDYDSEFRYCGRPLSALQGLDAADRVVYVGTFSKVLFPSLRLGYVVMPVDLIEAFTRAHALTNRQLPTIDQAVAAEFISEGHFARHIRRMRALYAERQDMLVVAVRRELGDQLEINCAEAGLHVVGWLPQGVDDKHASQAALEYGVETPPLSRYAMKPLPRGGLMLGYAALNERQIRDGARRLRQALSR